jgi:ABC-type uncharacterized transport system ATPase subunit
LELQKFNSKIPTGIVDNLRTSETSVSLTVSRENLTEFIDVLGQVGKVSDLEIQSPDLEDIFMKYYETSSSSAGSLEKDNIKAEGLMD